MEHDLTGKNKEGNGKQGENAHATRHLLEGNGGVQPFINEAHHSGDAKAEGHGHTSHDAQCKHSKN